MKLAPGGSCSERLWAAASDLREFRVVDLARRATIPEETARKYIRRWRRAGLVAVITPWDPRTGTTSILALTTAGPPPVAPSSRTNTARHRMWQSLRVLRCCAVPDLAATADVSTDAATRFVRALHRIGYLRRLRRSTGQPGGHAVYQLVRDTGPVPVRIGKHGIYDPNTDDYYPRRDDQ